MIQVQEGHQFDATLEGAPSGLTGTIGVRVVDPSTSTTLHARTTSGIVEFPAGSGVYGVTLAAPAIGANPSPWTVSVLWDTVTGGSPLTPAGTFTEDLIIYGGPVPGVPGIEGVPYFTVAEFRAKYTDVSDTTKYPDALVEEYRQMAEQAFEDAAGVAFVPRTATETLRSPNDVALQTAHRHVRTVDSATDAAYGAVDLSGGVRIDGSWLTLTDGWPLRLGAVTVTYTYGYDAPPLRVKQAVMALTREWMVSGPVTDRQTGIPVEGGGTISLALPGGRYGTMGIPEVDAAIEQYGLVSYVG